MDEAWRLVKAAAETNRAGFDTSHSAGYFLGDNEQLVSVALEDPNASLAWLPGGGWTSRLDPSDGRSPLVDLYLPLASSNGGQPMTVGHLGQSLDGFIATNTGDSYYVTGQENVRHLHRMRGLCDAVIVGAGTIAADDPQLTTRRVPGKNPLRVVLDRTRRLDNQYGVFNDGQAPTLLVCGDSARESWAPTDQVDILKLPTPEGQLDLVALIENLRARGCNRIFVEGGGVTVSAFLQASLLHRLQIAVAPLLIGDGRPAIRMPAPLVLSDCVRPEQRIFRMGEDILFECVLMPAFNPAAESQAPDPAPIERIL